MINTHTFHIPVMGIGFTVDTPLKVAQYGINSVISVADDKLLERMRKMYCSQYELSYTEITMKEPDYRAKRITAYLDLINYLAKRKFKAQQNGQLQMHEMVSEHADLMAVDPAMKQNTNVLPDWNEFGQEEENGKTEDYTSMGSIDVNIMTKVDKENYNKGEKLPVEFNDAHAALRGYANSELNTSLIFSAGMNPRLYSYLEHFNDFFPDEQGKIKKKIVLKVSDYRSAMIQGKFLAKKGVWVSEYRIESGLNCGGHAFATDGLLMGPILAEFRDKKKELSASLHAILIDALSRKGMPVSEKELPIKITAQGGVGTAQEHQFLLDHYQVDSVGWGTPFLLVPEATTVDDETREQLRIAGEDDLYLSDISPLGIPFNSLKGNTKDVEKTGLIDQGNPGSPCPKRYLALNSEFRGKAMCTASRQYQKLKLQELEHSDLTTSAYQSRYDKIVEKSCICVGLGTSVLLSYGLDTKVEGEGVSICPGPNMAYFSKMMTLQDIIDHIYGRADMVTRNDRPNMFIKEIGLYLDHLKNKIEEMKANPTNQQQSRLAAFADNLQKGMAYYSGLLTAMNTACGSVKTAVQKGLDNGMEMLDALRLEMETVTI